MNVPPCRIPYENLRLDAFFVEPGEYPAGLIGQERAMTALRLGLGIHSNGYNIFIMGTPGTGRRTALNHALLQYTGWPDGLQDKAFVRNFSKSQEPRLLVFPAGKARTFKKAVHTLVEDLKEIIAVHSDSREYHKKKAQITSVFETRNEQRMAEFETELQKCGFKLLKPADDDHSPDLAPIVGGAQTTFDELRGSFAAEAEGDTAWSNLRYEYYRCIACMQGVVQEKNIDKHQTESELKRTRRAMLAPIVEAQVAAIKDEFEAVSVKTWLDEFASDVLDHLYLFDRSHRSAGRRYRQNRPAPLARYGVNIIIERSPDSAAPIVYECFPNSTSLLGSVEPPPDGQPEDGNGYLRIRPGSLFAAEGGILVLPVEALMEDAAAWNILKRVMRHGSVELPIPPNPLPTIFPLKPEAIPVRVKVILIGGEASYDALYQGDADFGALFKICAEFDDTIERTPQNESRQAAFFDTLISKETLSPLASDGMQALLGHSVRLAQRRDRLCANFSTLADILREADFIARSKNLPQIGSSEVLDAVYSRDYVSGLPKSDMTKLISAGELLIELNGTAVGQVNGLAVHDRGYFSFGCPVVVTARCAPGDGGVINIEGESGLSGEVFDKAVLILSGYLRSRYAKGFPLSITASVCFEQSYTPIDGDSATAAQLSALISAITGVPLRQDIAVTGSVNQWGIVQPVGAVTEKIEGFFDVCSAVGLSGTQGVVLPKKNLPNLVLAERVVNAVRDGAFHLYAIESLDQILEILSGKTPGLENQSGDFPADSLNFLVFKALEQMAALEKSRNA